VTIISKATAFPKSVRPGIPKLGKKPDGWLRGPLSKHLREALRPIELCDDTEYRLVTVKRSRGGVVEREILPGRDIAVKTQFVLKAGDFLISKRQIVHGACGVVPPDLEGTVVSNEYCVLNSIGTIDLEFLKYLSHSTYFQETCFHSSIGMHVEKMIFKLEDWLKWPFDLPSIKEQQRIAKMLFTWDKAIAVQEKLVANAKAHKKAMMQQLLTGKKRLPGFTGVWKKRKLADCVAKIGSGVTPKGGEESYKPSGFALIRSQNVSWGQLLLKNVCYIDAAQHELMSATKLQYGDVLLNITGASIGRAAIYEGKDNTANVNQHVCIIRPNDLLNSNYLLAFLLSEFGQKQIDQFQAGGNRQCLNFEQVGSFRLLVPPIEEQLELARVVLGAEDQIVTMEDALNKLYSEKSALMQQLLTGKRRVKVEA